MPKKILVAEDSATISEMMKQSLEEAGFSVITAADGQDALEKARTQNSDLIVLDLMLPKIDGYKVCRMLKFDEKYKNIPVVILTARSGDADKKLASEVRADAYLVKPFEPETLISKIKEFLGSN